MRARKFSLFIATIAIVLLMVFSSFQVANVSGSTETNQTLSNHDVYSNSSRNLADSEELHVVSHRMNASEFQAMKNKVGVAVEGGNYNKIVEGYGTGLRAPTAAEWQEISQTTQIIDSVTYAASPSLVDNSMLPWFPPVGNQGTEGSCVAWSVGYYVKTFQEAKEHSWNLSGATWVGTNPGYPNQNYQTKIMSPEFLYNLISDGLNNGADFENAVNLTCSIGISSWQKMPYSQSDHSSWPSEQAWAEAPYYRGNASGIQYLQIGTNSSIESLKALLAGGNLVSIGVDADFYSSLTSFDFWTLENYKPSTSSINHANTIVGYDDNLSYIEGGVTRRGAFRVVNSWGKGGWEKVSDGFYWISYEAMKQKVGATSNVMFFYDKIDYQPELLASFKITHAKRGECQITVGIGSTSSPIATKSFTQYIEGGNFPFPSINMILDVTEFKNAAPRLYNQSYFLRVRDTGSSTVGTVTSFSVANVSSSDAPRATVNNNNVYLTLFYSKLESELTLTPTIGPVGTIITLNGAAFTSNRSVSLAYLNPASSQWISISNNSATNLQGQFSFNFTAPDLALNTLAGDNNETFDRIVFRAIDNANGLSCNSSVPFSEGRRGLTQVGTIQAKNLFGNSTNLTSNVTVVAGQLLSIEGKWFNPGNVTFYWDNSIVITTTVANVAGDLAANLTVPNSVAGRHEITLRNGNVSLSIFITRLLSTSDNYDGSWHNTDFTVNVTSDANNSQTYYKINNGVICRVDVDGQPRIGAEGEGNTLEYWSVDEFGNEELPHKFLIEIKLDKTAPSGMITISNSANYTRSNNVSLMLTASDVLSGLKRIRFSNDGVWDTEEWEDFVTNKNCTLLSGDGLKTVYYQIMDNAGLTQTYSTTITLDETKPQVTVGENQKVTTGAVVNFAAIQCNDNFGIASSVWSFGDGTTANATTATHTYASPGIYTATLTVQDQAGNVASSSLTITVENKVSSTIPEFSPIFVLPMLIALTLVGIVFRKKKTNQV